MIATGGTGGHVFPAYSLAKYFIKKNYSVNLTTDERGSKYLKDFDNLKLAKIPSSPLVKKYNYDTIFTNCKFILDY